MSVQRPENARSPEGARAAVLRRVREALANPPDVPDVSRSYRRSTAADVDLVALLEERVSDYRATVRRTTPAGLAGTVAAVLAERGVRQLIVPAGIPAAWLASARVRPLGDDPPLTHTELDATDGVITGCAVAIAETGTIVLDAGPDQGRRALSLLPDRHLCVVRSNQIVGDVPEALARLEPRRPLTWISGPSATSDIELQRVEGVHGPRILDVVIVDSR